MCVDTFVYGLHYAFYQMFCLLPIVIQSSSLFGTMYLPCINCFVPQPLDCTDLRVVDIGKVIIFDRAEFHFSAKCPSVPKTRNMYKKDLYRSPYRSINK